MFLIVTRRVCGNSVLQLECPPDQLLNVTDFWVGVAEDQMCTPSGTGATVCKAYHPDQIVDVGTLCQNKMLCELSFYTPQSSTGQTSNGQLIATCNFYVLSVTYSCVSKYCIEINKSLRLLAVLAVSANTDKPIYGTICNTLYQH